MRKLFLALTLAASAASNAQTAPDFTVICTDAVQRNLYTTLAMGKTVVLDFFYTTCQGCFYYAPVIDSAYTLLGGGSGNVEFWGLDLNENDATVSAFMQQYNVVYPCASGTQGGANAVNALYGIVQYPTYIVVCPDHHMYVNVNYPPLSGGFHPYVVDSCALHLDVAPASELKALSVSPNPASGNTTLNWNSNSVTDATITVYDITGRRVFSSTERLFEGENRIALPAAGWPAGIYSIEAVSEGRSRRLMLVR